MSDCIDDSFVTCGVREKVELKLMTESLTGNAFKKSWLFKWKSLYILVMRYVKFIPCNLYGLAFFTLTYIKCSVSDTWRSEYTYPAFYGLAAH